MKIKACIVLYTGMNSHNILIILIPILNLDLGLIAKVVILILKGGRQWRDR